MHLGQAGAVWVPLNFLAVCITPCLSPNGPCGATAPGEKDKVTQILSSGHHASGWKVKPEMHLCLARVPLARVPFHSNIHQHTSVSKCIYACLCLNRPQWQLSRQQQLTAYDKRFACSGPCNLIHLTNCRPSSGRVSPGQVQLRITLRWKRTFDQCECECVCVCVLIPLDGRCLMFLLASVWACVWTGGICRRRNQVNSHGSGVATAKNNFFLWISFQLRIF